MSFGTELRKTVVNSIPGVSTINSLVNIAKDPLGAIFGKHSVYNFNPWHPPGEWRGAEERRRWEAKRRALGYPPYTTELGREFKAWQKSGGSVRDFVPGALSSSSTHMPGGAQLVNEVGMPRAEGSERRSTKKRKRRKVRANARKKASGGSRRAARRRRLKFGSPAWRKRYLPHARRRRRRS